MGIVPALDKPEEGHPRPDSLAPSSHSDTSLSLIWKCPRSSANFIQSDSNRVPNVPSYTRRAGAFQTAPTGGEDVSKKVRCDCGATIEEPNDDALVEAAQKHATEVHNLELTPDQILSMAEPVPEKS